MHVSVEVTVYNQYRNPETRAVEWRPTVLRLVHWEASKGINVITSGLASADGLFVMIPFTVDAGGRSYLSPVQYAVTAPEVIGAYWTMTEGSDRIAKGAAVNAEPLTDMKPIIAAGQCYTITTVDVMDYGRPHMHHWEVYGK